MIKNVLQKIYDFLISYHILESKIYDYENYIIIRPRL